MKYRILSKHLKHHNKNLSNNHLNKSFYIFQSLVKEMFHKLYQRYHNKYNHFHIIYKHCLKDNSLMDNKHTYICYYQVICNLNHSILNKYVLYHHTINYLQNSLQIHMFKFLKPNNYQLNISYNLHLHSNINSLINIEHIH